MRAERSFAVVVAFGFLLVSCASNPGVTSDPDSATAEVAPVSEQPVPEGPRASDDASTPAEESVRTPEPLQLKVLAGLLRKAGVQSVALAEPPHGSPFRILYGQLAGATIFATAGRDHSALIGERTEVSRTERDGLRVRVLADEDGRYVSFRDQGVAWLLSDKEDKTPPDRMCVLIGLAGAIASAS